MSIQFGKTWWGEHWLRSLENVDYDNRLPRGASYARKGAVQSVKIKENTITARVAGSRATPYKVNLIVPPFFEEQVEQLMQRIVTKPALISKLLNRELDPAMLDIAEATGLKVFPKQWTDFKMQCSCPDWAVPCKHLAAVIYMVSREIDNDPFLVFRIHHLDLMDELNKRGIYIAEQKKNGIPPVSSFLVPMKQRALHAKEEADAERVDERVDFSQLRDIASPLVQLLPAMPPFYPGGDFREIYADQFIRLGKEAGRILRKKLDLNALFPAPAKGEEITHHTAIDITIDKEHRVTVHTTEAHPDTMERLIPALFRLDQGYLTDYQPSVEALHKVLYAAIHLTANGNIVPQIVQLGNKMYMIRWVPAMMDAQVRKLLDKLTAMLPANLLQVAGQDKKALKLFPIQNQTTELLSHFISSLVKRLSRPSKNDLFEDFFFKGKTYAFAGVGENALSGGIKVWLDRYSLTAEVYKPMITVTAYGDEDIFDVSVSIEESAAPESLPVPLTSLLKEEAYVNKRFKILQSLSLLSPFIKGLDRHIDTLGEEPIRFDNASFAPFLMEVLPAIQLLDIKILLPKSLQHLLHPKPSLMVKRKSEESGFLRLDDLLAFDWQVALGDTLLSPAEFKKLLKHASGLFRFKENYFYVSEADMMKLHKVFTQEKPMNAYQLLQTALSGEYEGAPVRLTDEVKKLINELTSDKNIPLPEGLNATLRPYQERGYSWMYRNSRIGFGSIIADDMGLGKTVQVIAILLKMKEENMITPKKKALVVVPTGLLTNWQEEITRFAPSITTHIHHGTARDLKLFDADVMLTTYGVCRGDSDLLKKQKWAVMVIDEAQNIKNHETAQTKAVKSIPAETRIAMSGTPVENRLSEFWSIMDYTNKGYLGSIKNFNKDYAAPIQVFNDEQVVHKFRKITSPFMMRRMKSDKSIISDLPDKVEQNQYALLTKQQAALYEKTMLAAMEVIEGFGEEGDPQKLFQRQGLILQMILALKQICNHPANFLKNGNIDPLLSGKVVLLFELLDAIIEAGEKVLLFTQFREMGALLERFIADRYGDAPLFYHGGCTVAQRKEMVTRFHENRADKIFVLSLKAAGTGLNLTAASHVIHFDLWWNPAVENQATDRAYRIGQQKNVMVHRFITKNSFEEKIDEMINKKKKLAEMTVSTGENWIGKLNNRELREIFEVYD